jgi:hypothetical protein
MSDRTPIINDPDAMYMALWVAVGVLLLFLARRAYGALLAGGFAGVVIVTQLFVTGIAVILLATVDRVDLRRWARPLTAWVGWTIFAVGVFAFLTIPDGYYASDVALFESWASHLLVQGQNPMGANMLAAEAAWDVSEESANITATTSGGVVSHYSYPGGTLVWSVLDQILVPGNRVGVVNLLASVGFLAWLVARVDEGLVPLALLTWLAPVVRAVSAARGMITPLWLFPLAVGLAAWYDDRRDVAGIGLGLAVASKQLAWPVAGLVVIHVLRTQGWRPAGRVVGIAGGVAALLVGYLAVWDPAAWATSTFAVFLPFGPELVAQGVGLTSLTVGGVTTVPRVLHTALVVGVGGALVGATWRWPERMQWVIPFGMILVLVVHYRTLPSYYAATVPLAVVALDARLQTRPPAGAPLLDRALAEMIVRFRPPDVRDKI